MSGSDILARIVTTKGEEVIAAQVERPLAALDREARRRLTAARLCRGDPLEDRGGRARGHRRDQAREPEPGRAARELRARGDRRVLRALGCSLPVGAHRPAFLPGCSRTSRRGARRLRAACAAQGIHHRRVPGRRVACARRRCDPADRRGARRRAAVGTRGLRAGLRAGRAGRGPRRRRARARAAGFRRR